MPFSPWMEKCIQQIQKAREHETDAHLVALVSLQRLNEEISGELPSDSKSAPGLPDPEPALPKAPRSAYRSAFQRKLDSVRSNLPKRARNDSESLECFDTNQKTRKVAMLTCYLSPLQCIST
jgi:hypothetical protein